MKSMLSIKSLNKDILKIRKKLLSIKNLKVSLSSEDNPKKILNGISLDIFEGQTHTIMGPNGSGKSSLALTIMGHPKFSITEGSIVFDKEDITNIATTERAKKGIFLAFQHPIEIEGISIKDFLYQAYSTRLKKPPTLKNFEAFLDKNIKLLKIKEEFLSRSINLGFSGGEKKLIEILQLAMLQPKIAILDEIDSGLDIDSLKTVCNGINNLKKEFPKISLIIITHYPRILHYLKTDFVHIMQNGKITQSGTKELAEKIEQHGYSKNNN